MKTGISYPPPRIPHYTEGGIPMAYPPMALYAFALADSILQIDDRILGVSLATLYNVAAALPLYLFCKEIIEDKWEATVATILIVTAPAVYFWQVPTSGFVRGLGYFFLCLTIASSYIMFKNGEKKYIFASAIGFGGALLSHPTYSMLSGIWVLTIYLAVDRSIKGLWHGIAVAAGGLIISSPWLVTVLSYHGVEPFMHASGTHAKLGINGPIEFFHILRSTLGISHNGGFMYPSSSALYSSTIGMLYLLTQKRYTIPAMYGALLVTLGAVPRFMGILQGVATAVFLFEVLMPRIKKSELSVSKRAFNLGVSIILILALLSGMLFASGTLGNVSSTANEPPSGYISDEMREAWTWMRTQTTTNASFVVLGLTEDATAASERTVLNVPWGAEWVGEYERLGSARDEFRSCSSSRCVRKKMQKYSMNPDYVYLRKESKRVDSFESNSHFQIVFSNNKIAIYEYKESD